MGIVRAFNTCQDSSGNITKEPKWTFDVDYVTQNNRSSQLRTVVCKAYAYFLNNCSELHEFLWTVRTLRATSRCTSFLFLEHEVVIASALPKLD